MRLIDADKFKEYIEQKSMIAKFLFRKGIVGEDSVKLIEIFEKDIDGQPTVTSISNTDGNARKITIFNPHVEIRIFVNDKMLADWVKCRRPLDNEMEPSDGSCYSCELYNEIYPECSCDICDIPEVRKKLKEWTGYGADE